MEQQKAYYHSPVGILEIKTSGDILNALFFINSWKGPAINENEIHAETDLSPGAEKTINQLKEYFEGKRKIFDMPLQQEGTVFQLKVWEQLTHIPYGRTISYLQLSKNIGDVKAIRAVGTTNGKNSISIIVPCHRVIGSNGDLVGYGGDLWRKKWLLAHEAKFENGVQTLF
ncbi:MAG: methylated-DNA--[protein]-cysteine S-methyltransferase [Ferruginibacter sp.]